MRRVLVIVIASMLYLLLCASFCNEMEIFPIIIGFIANGVTLHERNKATCKNCGESVLKQ